MNRNLTALFFWSGAPGKAATPCLRVCLDRFGNGQVPSWHKSICRLLQKFVDSCRSKV